MILSFLNGKQEVQKDIVININGRNRNISLDEIKKIKNIFLREYNDSEIIFNLVDCNETYYTYISKAIIQKNKCIVECNDNDYRNINNLAKNFRLLENFDFIINNDIDYCLANDNIKNINELEASPKYLKQSKKLLGKNANLVVKNMEEISLDEIMKNKIKEILFKWNNIVGVRSRDFILNNEYIDLYNELKNEVKIIPKDANELKRFFYCYYLIGENISYAFDNDGEPDRSLKYHSIQDVVKNKKATCEGYSKLLFQLLNFAQIKNICVTGKDIGSNNLHVWNQVLIDQKWYNCDISNDASYIQQNRKPEFCLVSDKDLLCKTDALYAKKCYESYLGKNKNIRSVLFDR